MTKHARTNFRKIAPYLAAANAAEEKWIKLYNEPYMPLTVEYLGETDHRGLPIYSMTHYGEQNGDLMADPDMTFSVDFANEEVHPLTFRNDYMGVNQEVYRTGENGKIVYSPRLLTDLDSFLSTWLTNLDRQGFNPFPGQPKPKQTRKKTEPYPDNISKFEIGKTYRALSTPAGHELLLTVTARTAKTVTFSGVDPDGASVKCRIDDSLTKFIGSETVCVNHTYTFCAAQPAEKA